jgi:hypothetical protein
MSECCKAKVVKKLAIHIRTEGMGPLHGLHCESWWVCTACYEPCLLHDDD